MKRILLTSTALVAFAGAAAADISLSGTAEFSYTTGAASGNGYSSDTEITAAASQALNNGYSASVSFTIDPEAEDDPLTAGVDESIVNIVTAGNITVANDTSSITYYIGTGVGAAYIGTGANDQQTDNGVSFGSDDPQVNETARIVASTELGGATVSASLDDGDQMQIGVSTDLGGTSLQVGFDQATSGFGAQISGDASGVSYTLAVDSDNAYGLTASTTAGGADLTLNMGDMGWDIGASMPLGAATVGVTLDDAQAWEVSISTALDAIDLGFKFDNDSDWSMTAGYTAGDMSVDFETANASGVTTWSMDASYDLGNGLSVGAGTTNTANTAYAEVNYDLGAGAALAIEYGASAAASAGPDEDINAGTSISVSFSF